jgi:glycosyltransferase involved in cell wall biosynthesis
MKKIRVCYFGTYREEFSRNKIIINGLREVGVDVIECHSSLWTDISDRVNLASGGWFSLKFFIRLFKAYSQLIKKFINIGDYDILIVGYPGQLDVFLAKILNLFKRKLICWDILMSIYLVAVERDLNKKSTLSVNILKLIENLSCKIADILLLESQEYEDWFVSTYRVNPKKFRLVPLGALESDPISQEKQIIEYNSSEIHILYWGGFLKSHGIECMVKAAKILSDKPMIRFEFVGAGPYREKALQLSEELGLKNVVFPGYITNTELSQKISQADICLGVFGNTRQSFMTIQNKIYECLSMGKPLITGDSALVSRTFRNAEEIYICERKPEDLANSILELADSPMLRSTLSKNGKLIYTNKYTPGSIGKILSNHIEKLIEACEVDL